MGVPWLRFLVVFFVFVLECLFVFLFVLGGAPGFSSDVNSCGLSSIGLSLSARQR